MNKPNDKSKKVFTFKQPGIYFWEYQPFYQQAYYPFWFEFSQNFADLGSKTGK